MKIEQREEVVKWLQEMSLEMATLVESLGSGMEDSDVRTLVEGKTVTTEEEAYDVIVETGVNSLQDMLDVVRSKAGLLEPPVE